MSQAISQGKIVATFICYVDNMGNILEGNSHTKNLVGYTCEKFSEVQSQASFAEERLLEALDLSEKYHGMLVEHGILKPVLTTEEKLEIAFNKMEELSLNNKQALEQNAILMQQNSKLMEKLMSLSEKDNGEVNTNE